MKILDKVKNWWEKDKGYIAVSLGVGFVLALGVSVLQYTKAYSDKMQHGIAEEVIRFHVLANSDGAADQDLKMKVKEAVIASLETPLAGAETKKDTVAILESSLERITDTANRVIAENGYAYPVAVSLNNAWFPTKTYGDIALPAGNYEALQIQIGDAAGANWWCCMFPPLCFVDVAQQEAPEEIKNELKNILTEEEYNLVAYATDGDNIPVKVKFKIVEMWQNNGAGEDMKYAGGRAGNWR